MGSIYGEDSSEWLSQCSSTHEEKIFVAVRLRPLNDREISKHDVSDWECIDHSTIIFKNSLQERAMPPTAYSFDRVFGSEAPTTQVYEEAAKSIVISVLSGINSTIFAYGQTSSGKTYTMSGITAYAIEDIYDYINKHREREFVLKFSAMEIYNEVVKDLLCPETQLRLLDDPERGTVVDKLTEVAVKDSDHLKELLSACEAQRQIGETALNEVSSRSHQILRLTVESEPREYFGAENSSTLTASVNFVDLAGSERASQTVSAGTSRLKEGCHINRSLLTLGTVIRKLSKGRNAHIPYRDSKLTRILQNSLGGNARTAIICTMSPAHTHVEQSRNTLLFANCAKQVHTNSQVNVVMSEKALVKQLQRELMRMENELRNLTLLSGSGASASVLKEKELLIEKMDKEIKELTHQRDLARSRIEDMIRSGVEFQSKSWIHMNNNNHEKGSWTDEYSASEASEIIDPHRFDVASRTSHFSDRYDGVISQRMEDNFLMENTNEEQFLSDDTSPRLYIDKYFGPDPCQGWEKIAPEPEKEPEKKTDDICKEAQCIEIDFTKRNAVSSASSPQLDITSGQSPSLSEHDESEDGLGVSRSISCAAILTTLVDSQTHEDAKQVEDTVPNKAEDDQENLDVLKSVKDTDTENESSNNSLISSQDCTDKEHEMVARQHSEVIKPGTVKIVEDNLDLKENVITAAPVLEVAKQSPSSDWFVEFERQKKEIIQLWHDCNIQLVHRTYFLLLFKGDPTDSVYMEVELRRLSFLKDTLHGARVIDSDQFVTKAPSAKTINREREMLARRMLKKFTAKEREALYEKWGINVKSKQRRLQLCKRLWTDTRSMEHINESASIVAKLVGLKERVQAPKEMFGLSFPLKPAKLRSSSSWRHSLPM